MTKSPLAYWIVTGLFAFALTGSGVMGLITPEPMAEVLAHLGYPGWFLRWLGLWKLVGVAVVLAPGLPRLKEWATAGFTIALSSAAVSHAMSGDGVGEIAPPLVMLGLGLASWALRPESRRFGASLTA